MKRVLAWIAWGYVAFGVLAYLVYLVAGTTTRSLLSIASVAILLPATLVAWRIHKFPATLVAILSAIGTLYVSSAVIASVVEERHALTVTASFDVVANALLVGAFAWTVRQRRGRYTSGDLLDGVVIGVGGWLAAWVLLVTPFLDNSEHSTAGLVLNALYLPMTTPLLALAAALLLSGLARRPATWLIVVAMLVNVLGDAIYSLHETGQTSVWAYTVADALYIVAFAAAGAALIHPTAPELIGRAENHRRLQLPGRLAVTGFALTIPVVLVVIVPTLSSTDRAVRAISALVLLWLVSWRLFDATRSHIRSQERLVEVARTDSLTGLPNRGALLEEAIETIDTMWRHGARPSIYLFDLDRFKNINDSLGHRAGDEVLQLIAERLRQAADSLGATLARRSGDEFIVLDTSTRTTGQALANAEVLQSVFKQPVSVDQGVVFVTASAGVATMPANRPTEAEDLFRWADIAMYRAKDAGRNCLALYNASMQERIAHRMEVETALHGAVDRREMRLFHQPIVDISSGRITGFEALMRWQRSDGTILSPAEFIPIAEETGIITSLGSWALLEALTQLRRWIDDGVVPQNTTVSVNVSPRQLSDPGFTDIVDEALARSAVPAHLLWLEVTESLMITEPEMARMTLQRLRSTGVRVALDDFGTGYSSLSLLQQFPLQRIKIDRAFVNGVADSSNDRSLVRTIIAMGGSLGLDVVAEGVETVQQLTKLRELGCSKAQGFLISHPVPVEAMRSTIAALESLSQWPAFGELFADEEDPRFPLAGA